MESQRYKGETKEDEDEYERAENNVEQVDSAVVLGFPVEEDPTVLDTIRRFGWKY